MPKSEVWQKGASRAPMASRSCQVGSLPAFFSSSSWGYMKYFIDNVYQILLVPILALAIMLSLFPVVFWETSLRRSKSLQEKKMGGHLKDGTDSRNPRKARRDHYEKLNLKNKVEICQPITH
jgi:hypothetical protein